MTMGNPLRYEITKYHKGKRHAIDGTVPGIPYIHHGKITTPDLGSQPRSRTPGYNHDFYMWGTPREYHPRLNAPAVQETEYDIYEPLEIHRVSRTINPRLPDESEQDDRPTQPGFVLPKDDLSLTERLRMVMDEKEKTEPVVLNEHTFNIHQTIDGDEHVKFDDGESTPQGVARNFLNITDALIHLQKVLPAEHPDIINLRTAMHDILGDPQAMSKLEILAGDAKPSKLGGGNPYERDFQEETENTFDEQIQMFDRQFESPTESEPLAAQFPNMFEDSVVEVGDSATLTQVQTLEEIVEDNFDDYSHVDVETDYMDEAMAGTEVMNENEDSEFTQIEQAIDKIKEEPLPEDPFQPMYGPWMDERYIFDPQYTPGYMMPGSMSFGPMGPMPM